MTVEVNENTLRRYVTSLTTRLGLRTYGEPVIHATSGQGKADNEGFDGFVPLIDSGIYIAVWVAIDATAHFEPPTLGQS